MRPEQTHNTRTAPYSSSILPAVGWILGILMLLLLLWQAGSVFLLIFAGALFALGLREASDALRRWLPLSERWTLTLILAVLLTVVGVLFWMFTPEVARQADELMRTLPQALRKLGNYLRTFVFGREILQESPAAESLLNNPAELLRGALGVFSTTVGALSGLGLVFFVGLYFAYDPEPYVHGIVLLFPPRRREKVERVLGVLSFTLRRWVIGRMVDMILTGVSIWLALWLLGIPLSFILGLLAGLFSFIPNLGPVFSALPAVLLGFVVSPIKALWVAAVYFAVNTVEGVLLMPTIEKRAVFLPPVLVIGSQLLFGSLFGFLGVALATPLMASAVILIKMLYIEDTLGDDLDIKGDTEEETGKERIESGG